MARKKRVVDVPTGYLPGGSPGWAGQDGSLAPAGGTAQHATLLSGYSVRPPWSVPGVDYAVGPHSGTSFTSIAVSQPSGTSYNAGSKVLSVTQDNVTIDGYDFSVSSGVQLSCSSNNNLIVRNCKWGGANLAALSTAPIDFRGSGLTFEYNTVDGGATGGTDAQACLIYLGTTSAGTVTIRYNWFKNYPAQIIEMLKGLTLDYRFNLIDDALLSNGAHMNWLQEDTSTGTFNITCNFNCFYQALVPGTPPGEGPQFYSSTAITLSSPSCQYNAMIAKTSGCMSYMVHGSNDQANTTLSGSPMMANNYFDKTGATNVFYPASVTSGWTVSGNKNMSNGLTIAADNSES